MLLTSMHAHFFKLFSFLDLKNGKNEIRIKQFYVNWVNKLVTFAASCSDHDLMFCFAVFVYDWHTSLLFIWIVWLLNKMIGQCEKDSHRMSLRVNAIFWIAQNEFEIKRKHKQKEKMKNKNKCMKKVSHIDKLWTLVEHFPYVFSFQLTIFLFFMHCMFLDYSKYQ